MADQPAIPLYGPNVMLEGASGTGKTYAIGTLVDWCQANNKQVFVLFTENGLETLLGYWRDRGKEVPECLHWHQQLTTPLSLASLLDSTDKVGRLSYESITKMQDPNRGGEANSFWKILGTLADFKDDRTGKSFGMVDKWEMDKVLVLDSLTELANAAMKMQIGNKPAAAPQDYGVAQNCLMNFIRLLTQGFPFTFVMTAHVEREVDQVTQTTKLMTKAIGRAIAGDIPPLFSDVIYTVREGDSFYWDTAAYGVDTKTRSLGYKSKLKPDFATIMDVWKKRGGA
jgi:hypothetical protein